MATYDLTSSIPSSSSIVVGDILNCPYDGSKKTITLPIGRYQLECWGARGGGSQDGDSNAGKGGAGGYSKGTLTLSTNNNTLYLYAGGIGAIGYSALSAGGFNGGGSAYGSSSGEPGCGGGGASDIRIGSDSLYARVIVAGGGGGGGEDPGDKVGVGGGATAGIGGNSTAAGQTSGGDFGQGRHAYDGGGGGGGWYGGLTVSNLTSLPTSGTGADNQGGGGGSGYVYTMSTAKNYPSGCTLNASYYLGDAKTIDGTSSFLSPTGTIETGHNDSGYIRITVLSFNTYDLTTTTVSQIKSGDVLNCPYSGSKKTVTLPPGTYQLECWGAQGGYRSSSNYGGLGGYSVGVITLTEKTTVFLYAGGAGNTAPGSATIKVGGFNGGGYRYQYNGGGGGSDIRIGQDSLYARVIVAGGGGSDGATSKTGMYGGGEAGGVSTQNYGSIGYGGTQTGNSGGSSYITTTQVTTGGTNSTNCYSGFGFGGMGVYRSSGYAGAGGGGWYGGCGSYPDSSGDDDRGGGGGSGYVYTSSTASNYPSGCLLNSSYYLADAATYAGNTSFVGTGSSNETGHAGDGYCRITVIEVKSVNLQTKINGAWKDSSAVYVKINGAWKEATEVYVKVNGAWKSGG